MLKKYYIVLFILLYSCNINASTTLVPPWNKEGGRKNTCLERFPVPSPLSGFYLQHCAEHTPESSYFVAKIRVRIQNCNALACWTQSTTLSGDGQCVLWPGAYGLPLTRICARVAVPAVENDPADPGYTVGHHLNNVGDTKDDERVIGDDGQAILVDRPKLCAYSDPGLINSVSATGVHLDILDWNPFSQPFHQTTELHPIAKFLKSLVDFGENIATIPLLLANLLVDKAGGNSQSNINIIKWLQKLMELRKDIVEYIIQQLGSLNNVVDPYPFGCVELPLGPFPPPYCSQLERCTTMPITQSICNKKNKEGEFIQSSTTPCVVSKLPNNIINNSVRVGFNHLIPLCKKNEDSYKTDKCVSIKNIELSASAIHRNTNQRDTVKKCSDSNSTACVATKIKFTCSVPTNGCEDGFRIVYAQKIANLSTPTDYYVDEIPDCGSAGNNTTCQEIWGVNIGEFRDVSLKFPAVQDRDDIMPLTNIFTLNDNIGTLRRFTASIVRHPRLDSATGFQQEPTEICVVESDNLVGCERRVSDGYKIAAYECGTNSSQIICPNNSYYTPQFIASIEAQDGSDDSTNAVITPKSISNNLPSDSQTQSLDNLAGYNFSSFRTHIPETPTINDVDTVSPFSGPESINPLTTDSKYKSDDVNGKYEEAETHGCLQPQTVNHCMPGIDDSNCVLTKLLESDIVKCSDFKAKLYQYPSLRKCNNSESKCQQTDSIAGRDGKQNIIIYKCDNSVVCYTNKYNNKEVCKIATNVADRMDPPPTKGPLLVELDDHYTVKYNKDGDYNTTATYDDNISVLRDKTEQELGLCVPIPITTCPAVSTPTADSGNATWPTTKVGKIAVGQCKAGWELINPKKPLRRYCVPIDSKTIAFELLNSDVGCKKVKK